MATIVDYSSLGQAVTDFSHRSDLASFVDYFIQLAQKDINDDIFDKNEGNGIRYMEVALTPTNIDTNGHFAVPSDYLALKDMEIASGQQWNTLSLRGVAWMYDNYTTRAPSGLPAYVAREASNFIFGPYPDSAYAIQGTYYQEAALLTSGAPTNWMVLKTPQLLLAAVMRKANLFIKDPNFLQVWEGQYQDSLQKLIDRDKAERWNASTLAVELG